MNARHMRPFAGAARRGLYAATALGALLAASCDQVTVVVLEPHRVEIAPDQVQLDLAQVSSLGARVFDADGVELFGYDLDWSVADPGVVELTGNGSLRAQSEGSTTVRASVGDMAAGSAEVEVVATRALSVEPGSFAFVALEGSGAPMSDQAVLTSTAAPIDGLQVTIAATEPGWIDVSLSSTTTDAILFVNVDPTGLPAGTYDATLTLASPVIRSVEVPVRLTVSAAPPATIVLAPGALAFEMTQGATTPLTHPLSVTTQGSAVSGLTQQITHLDDSTGWLSIEMFGTSTPMSGLIVATPPAGLPAGTYEAVVSVTAEDAVEGSMTVSLTVNEPQGEPPTIQVAPSTVVIPAETGGAAPAVRQLAVTSSAEEISGLQSSIEWGAGSSTGWMQAVLSTTTTPASLDITSDIDGLAAGTYTASVSIQAPGASSTSASVTLVVADPGAPPTLVASPATVQIDGEEGGAAPAPVQVSVTSTGAAVSGLTTGIDFGGGATGWLQASLSGATTPASLDITPSVDGLAAGSYNATISLSGTGATAATLPVTLVVAEGAPPALAVSPATVTISAETGGAAPATQQLSVTSSDDEVPGLAADIDWGGGSSGWLQAVMSATTTPASLDITASIDGLASGVYTATVNVTGTDATPTSVPVSLVVSDGTPAFSVNPTTVSFDADVGEDPAAVDVDITATNGVVSGVSAAITYGGGTAVEWLAVSMAGTDAPTQASLTASTLGLAEGTYSADVTFSATGAADVVLPVELTVSESGLEIVVPTPDIELVLPLGGSLLGLIPVPVLNVGSAAISDLQVDVEVGGGDPDWLDAEVTALAGPGSPGLLTLNAGAGMGSLASGSYSAVVTIQSTLYGTVSAQVRVRILVVDPGDFALAVVPGALALNASVGGGSVDGTADVHGLLPGILGVLGVVSIDSEIEYGSEGSGWLSASISDGGLSLLDPDSQVDLSANPAGLAPGTYQATVRVTGSVLGSPLLTVSNGTLQVFLSVPEGS